MKEIRTKWHIYATDNEYDDDVEDICVFVGTAEEAFRYAKISCIHHARVEEDASDVEYIRFKKAGTGNLMEAASIQRCSSHRVYWVEKFEEPEIRTIADMTLEEMILLEAHPDGYSDDELEDFFKVVASDAEDI